MRRRGAQRNFLMRSHSSPVFILSVIVLLALPRGAGAAGPLAISKISTAGPAEHEWILVENISADAVDFSKWKFWESNTNHGLKNVQGGATLLPDEIAVVANDPSVWLVDHPTSTLKIFDSAWGSLADEGEAIGLRDASGTLVESFVYPPTAGRAIKRIDIQTDPAPENWCAFDPAPAEAVNASCLPEPTPESEPLATTSTPLLLELSEFMPNPSSGGKEWVEVWNGGKTPLAADQCAIFDSSNQIALIKEEVAPQNYSIIELSSAKLNNDGDSVKLVCAGNELDAVAYGTDHLPAPEQGETVARVDSPGGDWQLTTAPTPGEANTIVTPTHATPVNVRTDLKTRHFARGRVLVNEIFPGPAGLGWIELGNPESRGLSLTGWTLVLDGETPLPLQGTLAANGYLLVNNLTQPVRPEAGIIFLIDPDGFTAEQVVWGGGDNTEPDNAPRIAEPGASLARVFDRYGTGDWAEDFATTAAPTPGETNTIVGFEKEAWPLRISEILPNPAGPDEIGEFVELENSSSSTVKLAGWSLALAGRRPVPLPVAEIPANGHLALGREETKLSLPNSGAKLALLAPNGQKIQELNYGPAEAGLSFAENNADWAWTTAPTPGETNNIVEPIGLSKAVISITEPEGDDETYGFDASDSWSENGSLAAISWDFGDGGFDRATSTAHVFASSGRFAVALTVIDARGVSSTAKKTLKIKVVEAPTAEKPKVEIAAAKTTKKKTTKTAKRSATVKKTAVKISLSGQALAEPGLTAAGFVVLAAENRNVLVKLPKDAASISRGDFVRAAGMNYKTATREYFKAESVAAEKGPAPEPQAVAAIDDLADLPDYSLVAVEGAVVQIKGQKITLSENGELTVKLPKSVKASSFAEGEVVRVTGLLAPTGAGIRELIIRDQGDVALVEAAPAPKAKTLGATAPFSPLAAGATGAAGGILIAALWGATGDLRRKISEKLIRLRGSET